MGATLFFGLMSALLFGGTDFVARFAGRKVGTLRTMFYGHSLAASALTLWVLRHGLPQAPVDTWLVLAAANLVGLLATACLYRALARGLLRVVAPVTATYGGVTALLSLIAGEPLRWTTALGLALAFIGGVLVATPARSGGGPAAAPVDTGVTLAAAAALLYGLCFWLQGEHVVPRLGAVVPTWSYYLSGVLATALCALIGRHSLAPPPAAAAPLVFGTTVLACAASLCLAAGQAGGEVAVATVLSALASAVTVLLARFVLKDVVPRHGWFGIAMIVAGLALLNLG
jgi:drug/metabolite transporter (DMT)-like permease